MKSFIAFSKKEFIEYLRTYKLFISIMIFLILGFLNPISAKYLPEIVSLVMPEGVMNILHLQYLIHGLNSSRMFRKWD